MVFARWVNLKKFDGADQRFEIGENNVKEISIFQSNSTVRIDFEDNSLKIFQFKDFDEVEHLPLKESGIYISPIDFK